MRKTKEIKRKRINAALEFRRGNRKEAYKMWSEAKKELDELRGRNKPAAPPAEKSAEAPTAAPAAEPAPEATAG